MFRIFGFGIYFQHIFARQLHLSSGGELMGNFDKAEEETSGLLYVGQSKALRTKENNGYYLCRRGILRCDFQVKESVND